MTNRLRPILLLEEDTSPGRHDTIIATCDVHRYAALGCRDYHKNWAENLHAVSGQMNLRAPDCPAPMNLWRNIPVGPDGKIIWGVPLCRPGDYVTLRAVIDYIVVRQDLVSESELHHSGAIRIAADRRIINRIQGNIIALIGIEAVKPAMSGYAYAADSGLSRGVSETVGTPI